MKKSLIAVMAMLVSVTLGGCASGAEDLADISSGDAVEVESSDVQDISVGWESADATYITDPSPVTSAERLRKAGRDLNSGIDTMALVKEYFENSGNRVNVVAFRSRWSANWEAQTQSETDNTIVQSVIDLSSKTDETYVMNEDNSKNEGDFEDVFGFSYIDCSDINDLYEVVLNSYNITNNAERAVFEGKLDAELFEEEGIKDYEFGNKAAIVKARLSDVDYDSINSVYSYYRCTPYEYNGTTCNIPMSFHSEIVYTVGDDTCYDSMDIYFYTVDEGTETGDVPTYLN